MTILRILFLVFIYSSFANKISDTGDKDVNENLTQKTLYIPSKVWYVPENNDYKNEDSDYSYSRMIESDNIAMFWHKEYGNNPMGNTDTIKRFDPKKAIIECERFYNYYVNDLKLVLKGHSFTDKYKLLIYVFGGNENTAFGGGEEEVGILWTPAVRINKAPYGALAHEMGHSFQYLGNKDSKTGPKGPIMEMSAQYMLWQVYPEWMTFENYHLIDFLKGTHYAFLHPANMYHSPYIIEYWSHKHGIEFWGHLSRSTQEEEDLVMTYKRINNITQEQFNDEIFDASRKFITWDLPRIDRVTKPYRNIHKTKLHEVEYGWFEIDSINAPQNYGYNGIKLQVPEPGTLVKLEFESMVGAEGYTAIKTDKAGWRYGFIASLKEGKRIYGDVYKKQKGTAEFKVPENTEYLWLVEHLLNTPPLFITDVAKKRN
nr:DUF6055 domain-containing protein [Mariniflexile sp. KMM 9835]